MPLRVLAALLAVLVISLAPASAQEADAEVQWLMVVQGAVVEVGDDRLALAAPATAVVFTDRPARRVGFVSLAAFVTAAWGEGGAFRADPPNASLVDEASNTIAVVTVNRMGYADGLLTIAFTLLEGALPVSGDTIALTIDAFPTSVNGQITDAVTQTNTKVLGDAPGEAMGNLFVPE